MRRYLKKKHAGAMKGSEALVLCFDAATATTLLQCKSLLRRAKAITNLQTRAEALVCIGGAFNRLRTPEAFLDAIGDKPWPIEETYPAETRFNLSLERSSALRYVGRLHEALSLAGKLAPLAATLPDPKAQRMLKLNIAILERDTGRPDKAIEALTSLLGECPDLERLDVLQSLAIAYQIVGRNEDAAAALAEATALGLADAKVQAYLLAAEALARANANQLKGALDLLAQLPAIDRDNRSAVLAELGAWAVVVTIDHGSARQFRARLKELVGAASHLAMTAREAGANLWARTTFEAIAFFADAFDRPDQASRAARLALEEVETQGGPTHAAMPLFVAAKAFTDGEFEGAREALSLVPQILRSRYGGVANQEAALAGFHGLERGFERVTRAARLHGAADIDLRVIMELRREAFRHTRPDPSSTVPTRGLYEALDDIEIAQLAPGPGRVLVLEWLDVGGAGAFPQVTALGLKASPQVLDLPPLALKASSIAPAILDRLEHWVGDGDPFNLDSWRIVERWVKDALGPQIRPGDHIVVIEDHSASHLPWHVALGPIAPVSYAASWSSLLRIAAMETARGDKGLGVSMVPRQDENEVIRVAFETTYAKLETMASRTAMRFLPVKGPTADTGAVFEIIGGSYLAVLLCHGIYLDMENEVALLVADAGRLPPKSAAASHRLSWRDIAQHPRAAQIIVSPACSSGAGFFAGLGERLGLFREFQRGGTRALIAPRWRSHAPTAGDLVVDLVARHLVDGKQLGLATRNAALAAIERGVPPRHAWNLALEGDWR
jgi:tetratricopeptide (TPR) repeat protein